MPTDTFKEGDPVEFKALTVRIPGAGNVAAPTGAEPVIRGRYIRRLGDAYSEVMVRGKAEFVRTDRLRRG